MNAHEGNRIVVSTRKGLFTIERSPAGKWGIAHVSFAGDPVTLSLVDPRDGAWYAKLEHGHFGVKLHRSHDEGKSWSEIAVPVYPPQPHGEPETTQDARLFPWSLKMIWSLEPGGRDEDGVLWCGTIPGGLFRSTDRGDSWELIESLWMDPRRRQWFGGGFDWPGIHSICVHPQDSRRLLVGVSCGGVWETTDSGATWTLRADGLRAAYMPPELADEPNIQDPHRMVQCPAAPDSLWIQHHNGIFRSMNGAGSWEEITGAEPSAFGFAVAVHPTDPDIAWFVPAQKDERRIPVDGKVVVTRTRNGGRTFEALRHGLSQEHAYDLTYRHALDVDASGPRLVFGSTTGSLWISEDQGDTWQTVSEHLPPVYAVRFAPG